MPLSIRPDAAAGAADHREILFEFQPQGRSVRVAAIDPETNTEVAIVGLATAGERALKTLAARKLAFVLSGSRNPRRG